MQKTVRIRKNPRSKTFKVLQRETSVYKYYVELKEEVFTEQGYLDLAKVPGLYVSGAAQYLRNIRKTNDLSRKDIIGIFEVSRSQMTNWENNNSRIPLQTLVKIAETLGDSRDTIYSLIDQEKFLLRSATLPVKFEKIQDIVQYFTPYKDNYWAHITLHNFCPNEMLSRIKKTLNIKVRSNRRKWKIIACRDLYNFLTTFFRYTKVPKIHPPLTNEVKNWYHDGVDVKRAVIIPCLQSDGCISQGKDSKIRFRGYNKVLHEYFVDAVYYEYKKFPSVYFMSNCETVYYRKSMIVDDVMNLAGSAKTTIAHGQTIEEYLKEPQPHLKYLKNASRIEQQIALRIWASTEGCITAHRNDNRLYPDLVIGCAHPELAKQLQQLARRLNVNLHIKHSEDYWSGIMGLYTSALSTCINFLKLGGFIKGVKIGANSKYHQGINKDVLFLGILEFKKRELENSHLKKLPIQQVRYKINNIIENREYKKADYYINYFS
ncbi:MAG: helix-turn-helix transcriptional regulator [Promethearchaeota archaeon]